MANEQSSPLEAMLGQLLSDPARMAQLQGMVSALGTTAAPEKPAESDTPPAEEAVAATGDFKLDTAALSGLSGLLPLLGGTSPSPKKHSANHRTALLMALRPYLNDGRREMIDAIVNFSRLGEMLGPGKEG